MNFFTCPKCGREGEANVTQADLVMCGHCLMQLCFAQDRYERENPIETLAKKPIRLRLSSKSFQAPDTSFRFAKKEEE